MRLFHAWNSPHARKVRIVAHELGLAGEIELVDVTLRDPTSKLLQHSPIGRVPALETREGRVLTESSILCEYLESLVVENTVVVKNRLRGRSDEEKWEILRVEGLAHGCLEGLIALWRERKRPIEQRSAEILSTEQSRAERCAAALVSELDGVLAGHFSSAHIALICALGFADHFLVDANPLAPHDRLCQWHDTHRVRSSVEVTAPRARSA